MAGHPSKDERRLGQARPDELLALAQYWSATPACAAWLLHRRCHLLDHWSDGPLRLAFKAAVTSEGTMLTLYGNLESGNVYKVRLILALTGVKHRRVEVNQVQGVPRGPAYR